MSPDDAEDELDEDGEDDEEWEAQCPYCGSTDGCRHLLALLDESTAECCGGYLFERYHQFYERLQGIFWPLLAGPGRPFVLVEHEDVAELWAYALENYAEGQTEEEVAVDAYVMMRLVREVLGDETPGNVFSGSGPGNETVQVEFHARNPAAAFKGMVDRFEKNIRRELVLPKSLLRALAPPRARGSGKKKAASRKRKRT